MTHSLPSLARNIAFNLGGRGGLILLSLLTTPLLLNRLGSDAYGVYVLALTLGGLLNVLDLGLTSAVILLLGQAWHRQAHEEMQQIISTALTLFLGVGMLGGSVVAILTPLVVAGLLHVPLQYEAAARAALWISSGSFALNMILSIYNIIPIALERYDLTVMRTLLLSFITNGGVLIYVWFGGTLAGLMVINLLGTLIGLLLFYVISRRLLPEIRFRPGFDRRTFRALARFGSIKFVGNLGGILSFRFDQFAIGAFLGTAAVGYYAIPANVAVRVNGILYEAVSPLFPRVSKLRADTAAMRALFLRGSRLMMLMAALAFILLFNFADHLLLFWIGGDQGRLIAQESTATLRWLASAFLIQSLAAVPVLYCEAFGKPEINNGFAVASAIIHIPLVLICIPAFGVTGAAIALFINSTTQTLAFILYASNRVAGVNVAELFRHTLARPLLAALAAGLLGFILRPLAQDLIGLLLTIFLVALAYIAAAFAVSAVVYEDIAFLGKFGSNRLRRVRRAHPSS